MARGISGEEPYFSGPGEYGASGAVFIKEGTPHIVLHPERLEALQGALGHELTHASVAHLSLPLWVEEGVTQYLEFATAFSDPGQTLARQTETREQSEALLTFWRTVGLQSFWSGNSFFRLGPEQGYSYSLAVRLLRAMSETDGYARFLETADRADFGQAACIDAFGRSVETFAEALLGPGDWTPVPQDLDAFIERARFHARRFEYESCLADAREAVRQAPGNILARSILGWALACTRNFKEALAVFEKSFELQPEEMHALDELAWFLATCPEETLRDPRRAVALALLGVERAGPLDVNALSTVAAAHASALAYAEAEREITEAIKLANPEQMHALELEERRQAIARREPWVDLPRKKPDRPRRRSGALRDGT